MLRLSSLLALVAVLLAPLAGAQDFPIRTVLLSDADPGTGDGAAFEKFLFVTLNDAGDVVFEAELEGPGVTSSNDRGLWLVTRTGDLVLLGREGDLAPDPIVPGARFRDFIAPATLNNSGTAAFEAILTGPGIDNSNNEVFYAGTASGGLAPIVREGDPAPGLPGLSIGDPQNFSGGLRYISLNDAGEVAFTARVTGPGVSFSNNEALYSGTPGNLTVVLREGEAPPPGLPGTAINTIGDTPELLPDGTVGAGFRVLVGGDRVGTIALLDAAGVESIVAVEGETSPGGVPYESFVGFSVNADRDVLFLAGGNTATSPRPDEIIAGEPGDLRLVAQAGNPAPGIPGRSYLSVGEHRLGLGGEVVYSGFVTPAMQSDNQALWATSNKVAQLVAFESAPAPGGGTYAAPQDPVIGNGVVVFSDEPNFGGRIRLFVWTAQDGVRPLPASTIEVAPGEFRATEFLDYTESTIFGNEFGAGGAGEPQAINARGEFAFLGRFTDDAYGLFIAQVGDGPALGLALTPLQTEVPAAGGPVRYTARIENTGSAPQSVDAWARATLPNGNTVPAFGPITVTLQPGQVLTRTIRQTVPGTAPTGGYTFTGFVGDFPSAPEASASFGFTKLGGAARTGGAPALMAVDEATGAAVQPGDVWQADTPAAPETTSRAEATALAAYPNPFGEVTTLRFGLSEASAVRLVIYDVLGREIAVLADGPYEAGAHEATLSGRGLAAGTYVWRLEASGTVQTGRIALVR